MGCVVNGPGEAREADLGIAGGGTPHLEDGSAAGALFEKGKAPEKVQGDLAEILIIRAREMARDKAQAHGEKGEAQ